MTEDPKFVFFVKTPAGEFILSSDDAVTEAEADETIFDISELLNGEVAGAGLDLIDRYGRRIFIPTEVLRNSIIGFYTLEEER